ncbi:hypothetical protein V2J09_000013 [Rumex salicifolius]
MSVSEAFGVGWRWTKLARLLPNHILLQLAAVPITESLEKSDDLIWSLTADGDYSVKSGYEFIQGLKSSSMCDRQFFQSIWKLETIERTRAFIWLTSKGGTLSNLERVRRHMATFGLCPMCDT